MNVKNVFVFLVLLCLLAVHDTSSAEDYTIGIGDQLAIIIPEEPEFSGTATVRPDGKITVNYLGETVAAGRTPQDLEAELNERLTDFFFDPEARVAVVAATNDSVYVIGGGVNSTLFEVRTHRNMLELLAAMGGLTTVDLDNARLIRGNETIPCDFVALYEHGNATANIPLKSHDIVFLPPARDANVYVVGAVENPVTIPWQGGMTFLDALLQAGGFNKFASPNCSKVVRSRKGQKQIIEVEAGDLVEDGDVAQNILLERGDMIIVEESFF